MGSTFNKMQSLEEIDKYICAMVPCTTLTTLVGYLSPLQMAVCLWHGWANQSTAVIFKIPWEAAQSLVV